MFRPHLSYIAAISVNRRTSGYPWRGGPVRSDFQWRLLYPVNLRCLARSGRWRQRSSKWLGMLVIMLWTRCQVLISHLHNSWILNHSNEYKWKCLLVNACKYSGISEHQCQNSKTLVIARHTRQTSDGLGKQEPQSTRLVINIQHRGRVTSSSFHPSIH